MKILDSLFIEKYKILEEWDKQRNKLKESIGSKKLIIELLDVALYIYI